MKTYFYIWLLRWKLWQVFGLPFAPTVAPWRVIIRKRKLAGGKWNWYFYNRIDGQSLYPPVEGRDDCQIGPVFAADSDVQSVLQTARQQYVQTQRDHEAFHKGEYKPQRFSRPAFPAPPPNPTPPEPTAPGHEKQWLPSLDGIICECGWKSSQSSHTLHLANGTCKECRDVWAEWFKHIEGFSFTKAEGQTTPFLGSFWPATDQSNPNPMPKEGDASAESAASYAPAASKSGEASPVVSTPISKEQPQ